VLCDSDPPKRRTLDLRASICCRYADIGVISGDLPEITVFCSPSAL
jgi:hypothetical protein